MSMNLHVEGFELWQTPTWITHLAMSDSKGQKRSPEEVKHIYAAWVKSTLQGRWDSVEEHRMATNRVKSHLEELDTVEPLAFFVM